jgi:P-type Cu+ transporter
VDIIEAPGISETEVLRRAAAVESPSEHPLARAIVDMAREKGLALPPVADFGSDPGLGAWGKVDGHTVMVGNLQLLHAHQLDPGDFYHRADAARARGATAVYVVLDRRVAGLIVIEDAIKQTTPEAIAALKAAGIRVIMLTGDDAGTAQAVAKALDLNQVEANVRPQDKAAIVRRLQAQGSFVAMAGDGVNDAPALAQANVGIAMGTGTDVAMASAGITLVKGDLRGIVKALRLSRRTMRNIRQNLFFAFVYNALGVPVAAGVLYPFFGVLLSPVIASAAMSLSSVSVIANALRLRRAAL